LNFKKFIKTQNTIYGIDDSIEGRVVAQRVATKNSFGISNHEPLYFGVSWKQNEAGQLVILNERNVPVLITTKIVEIRESLEAR
jgi:hypothetical protein